MLVLALLRTVATCFQAGVDYTEVDGEISIAEVATCFQAGVDYTPVAIDRKYLKLRLAFRPGLITLRG